MFVTVFIRDRKGIRGNNIQGGITLNNYIENLTTEEFLKGRGNGGLIQANSRMIRVLGTNEAIIYMEIANKFYYYYERGELLNITGLIDGQTVLEGQYFYYTAKGMERKTGIKRTTQYRVIKTLEDEGLINCVTFGNNEPRGKKRYFTLTMNSGELKEYLEQKEAELGINKDGKPYFEEEEE